MSSEYITFMQRGLPNADVPVRNNGIMNHKTVLDTRLTYAVGGFITSPITPIRGRSGIKGHVVGVLRPPTPKANSYHPPTLHSKALDRSCLPIALPNDEPSERCEKEHCSPRIFRSDSPMAT